MAKVEWQGPLADTVGLPAAVWRIARNRSPALCRRDVACDNPRQPSLECLLAGET